MNRGHAFVRGHKIWPWLAAILGLAGALFRAQELRYAFEPETGLAIPGQITTVVTTGFAVFAALVFVVLAVWSNRRRRSVRSPLEAKGTLARVLILSGGFLLLVPSVWELINRQADLPLSRLIFLLLAIFSGISVVISMRSAAAGKQNLFFSLVPVFWACYWLVLMYSGVSSDPVVLDYVYDLLAVVSLVLVLYYSAGLGFGSGKHAGRALFCGMAAVFFCLVAALGPALCDLMSGSSRMQPMEMLMFLAGAVYALGILLAMMETSEPRSVYEYAKELQSPEKGEPEQEHPSAEDAPEA